MVNTVHIARPVSEDEELYGTLLSGERKPGGNVGSGIPVPGAGQNGGATNVSGLGNSFGDSLTGPKTGLGSTSFPEFEIPGAEHSKPEWLQAKTEATEKPSSVVPLPETEADKKLRLATPPSGSIPGGLEAIVSESGTKTGDPPMFFKTGYGRDPIGDLEKESDILESIPTGIGRPPSEIKDLTQDLLFTAEYYQSLAPNLKQKYLDQLRMKYPDTVYRNMVAQLGGEGDAKGSGIVSPVGQPDETVFPEFEVGGLSRSTAATQSLKLIGVENQQKLEKEKEAEFYKEIEDDTGVEHFDPQGSMEAIYNKITTSDYTQLTDYLENFAEIASPEPPLFTPPGKNEVQLVLGEMLAVETGEPTQAWGYYEFETGEDGTESLIFKPVSHAGQLMGQDYFKKLNLWQNLQDFRQRVLLAVDTDARRAVLEEEAMRLGSELNISEANVRATLAQEATELESKFASTRQSNQAFLKYLQVVGGKVPEDSDAFGEFAGKSLAGTEDSDQRKLAASQLISVFMQQGGTIPDDKELFGELAGEVLTGSQKAALDLVTKQTTIQQEGAIDLNVLSRIFEIGGTIPNDERFGVLAGKTITGSRDYQTQERKAAEEEKAEEADRAEQRRLDQVWLNRVLEQGTDKAIGEGQKVPDDSARFGEFAGMYLPGKRKYEEELAKTAFERKMADTAIRMGISSATTQKGIDEAIEIRKNAEQLDKIRVTIDILSKIAANPIFLRQLQQSDILTTLGVDLGYDFSFMTKGPGDLAALGQVDDLIHLSDFEKMQIDERTAYLDDLAFRIGVRAGDIRGEIVRRAQGGGLATGLGGLRTVRRVVGAR